LLQNVVLTINVKKKKKKGLAASVRSKTGNTKFAFLGVHNSIRPVWRTECIMIFFNLFCFATEVFGNKLIADFYELTGNL
jgi:hypothetical protein